jgi:hypothetical protein
LPRTAPPTVLTTGAALVAASVVVVALAPIAVTVAASVPMAMAPAQSRAPARQLPLLQNVCVSMI